MTAVYAAGGLYSTFEDLHRWDRALYTDRVALDEVHRRIGEALFEGR